MVSIGRGVGLFGCALVAACSGTSSTPTRDAGVTGVHDGGPAASSDAGRRDGGTILAPTIAYRATVDDPWVAHLFVADDSNHSSDVTPTLAGGPTSGGEGTPVVAGVKAFAWSADGTSLVYLGEVDTFGFSDLYVASVTTPFATTKKSLAMAGEQVWSWTTSTDGAWLVFPQLPVGATWRATFAAPIHSAAAPNALRDRDYSRGRWSPTHPTFVFSADNRLWQADFAAGAATAIEILSGTFALRDLVWSSDGARIVYFAQHPTATNLDLWRAPVTNGIVGAPERLVDLASFVAFGDDAELAYAPTGAYIAVIADHDVDRRPDLYVVDAAAPAPATMTRRSRTFPASAIGVDSVSWSASGTQLAYVADETIRGRNDLIVTDVTGTTYTHVNPGLDRANDVRWHRGDTLLTFVAYTSNATHLYAVDPASPTPVDLGEAATGSHIEFAPSGDLVAFIDGASNPTLHIATLTAPVGVARSLPTRRRTAIFHKAWCWSNDDALAFIGADGHLYLLEDPLTSTPVRISAPMVAGGDVIDCAFRP